MRPTIVRQFLCAIAFTFFGVGLASAQQTSIGTITFQIGDTRLERDGTSTPITKGQTLKEGDRLITGADGHVHARMVDDGFISVRPSSRLYIQSYVYAPQDRAANRVGLTLESGVSRTISGKAGEAARENYRFNTPVAAIGLRGTDYVVQALPEITRVSVSKGAVTMSAFGPGCLANSLSPCTGPLVRELSAAIPHAYMEVRTQGGLPVIVSPGIGRDAPNQTVPPRPEELRVFVERPLTTALASELLGNIPTPPEVTPPIVTPPIVPIAIVTPPIVPKPIVTPPIVPKPIVPEIAWGRWSSVALNNVPTIASFAYSDFEITFSNSFFGLLRPSNSTRYPDSGVIGMNLLQGDVYLQTTQPGLAKTLTQGRLANGSLQLDFNKRQFATQLTTVANGTPYELNSQGTIYSQGMFVGDAARSNMDVLGAMSNNAKEAGYLFDALVAPNQKLVGVTRWGR